MEVLRQHDARQGHRDADNRRDPVAARRARCLAAPRTRRHGSRREFELQLDRAGDVHRAGSARSEAECPARRRFHRGPNDDRVDRLTVHAMIKPDRARANLLLGTAAFTVSSAGSVLLHIVLAVSIYAKTGSGLMTS